ncbi:MAG: phage major capsid protein [Oscillospiraceae bacterium]|nr:phage major capsid protein [Oscillospiraceae bacterium]
MEKLIELRKLCSTKWEEAKAFLESKRDDSGEVSAENVAVYDKMEAEVKAKYAEIERLENQQAFDNKLSAITDKPAYNEPMEHRGKFNSFHSFHSTDSYSKAFWNAMRYKVVTNDLNIGVDTQGGYLVPDEFNKSLVESLSEHNIMRQLCRIIVTSHGDLQIPVVTAKGTAAWIKEAGGIPASDVEFGQVTLAAHKLGTVIRVSNELLYDSAFPLESFIAQDFGRRIGTLEEEAFIVDDGVDKPTGVLTLAQVGVTTESATEITFDEVIDLYHSLKSPYRNKAVFIANDLTVKALRKLKDTNGQYLWTASVVAGTPDTILGRPVYTSSFVPQIQSGAKVMAFGDMSYYWIGDRQGKSFDRLNELYSIHDQVGFKATQRVDGKLILPESVQVLQMG